MSDFLTIGFSAVLTFHNLLLVFFGVFLGTVVGAIPGLTATLAISLLIPMTFGMDAIPALVLLLGIYCGGIYGGSVTAILINAPGTPGAAATLLDGHPMAKQGRAGEALGISTISSALGGLLSALILVFLAQKIAFIALKFSAQEYFAISVFGLTVIVSLSNDLIKGMIAGLFGFTIGFIGLDGITSVQRFTFGSVRMMSGINMIPVIIGLFAITEILRLVEGGKDDGKRLEIGKINRILPPAKVLIRLIPTFIRSSIIGTFVGILPGAGANIASFISYNEAKRASKHPELFGTGIEEGVAACETANNAVTGGAMIPMLTLGIPGDAVTAVLLSALLVQGFAPGPLLFSEHIDVVYPIYAAMILANIFVLIIGLVAARPVAKIAMVSKKFLVPGIAIFAMIGSFASSGYLWDLWVTLVFGILGYILYKLDFEVMPIVLGLLLGDMVERYFRQAMILSQGDWTSFFTRPISCILLLFAVCSVLWNVYKDIQKNWLLKSRK